MVGEEDSCVNSQELGSRGRRERNRSMTEGGERKRLLTEGGQTATHRTPDVIGHCLDRSHSFIKQEQPVTDFDSLAVELLEPDTGAGDRQGRGLDNLTVVDMETGELCDGQTVIHNGNDCGDKKKTGVGGDPHGETEEDLQHIHLRSSMSLNMETFRILDCHLFFNHKQKDSASLHIL